MTTLFISDLHLSTAHPAMLELFLKFLQTEAPKAEALYILGDFFEAWIGDDNLTEFNQTIIDALKKTTAAGTPTYLMRGNRDFLIGKRFAKATGCQLIKDPTLIELYGKKTLLMHGDTLCLADEAYLKFRKIAHNRLVQLGYLSLPLKWRQNLANRARAKSQQASSNLQAHITDVTPAAIEQMMQQHQAAQLIHGHTHRPSLHYFQLNQQWVVRIVLSDWEKCGNVLVCKPDGSLRLQAYTGTPL